MTSAVEHTSSNVMKQYLHLPRPGHHSWSSLSLFSSFVLTPLAGNLVGVMLNPAVAAAGLCGSAAAEEETVNEEEEPAGAV